MPETIEEGRYVRSGDLNIYMSDQGPEDGTPVLLIHGWPDTARLWRHQVPAFAGSGYRALAPDARGRGRSDRPSEVADYHAMSSIPDMLAVLDAVGAESAHVVAHDWGAAVGWGLAITQPHRVRSFTAISVGHPNAFRTAGLQQLMRSWYMLLFQFEGIAEQWLSQNDWAMFRKFSGNHPETQAWIDNLSGEGSLSASLNWYRANAHPSGLIKRHKPVPPSQVPTLGLWSSGDFALTESQMTGSAQHVVGEWRYERIDDSSHWIPLDQPDRLNDLLLDWFASH